MDIFNYSGSSDQGLVQDKNPTITSDPYSLLPIHYSLKNKVFPMKAVVTNQWHDATLQDVDKPTVGPGECLIQLKLAGICGSDVHIYEGHHPTAKAPETIHEFRNHFEINVSSAAHRQPKKRDASRQANAPLQPAHRPLN